MAPRSTSFAWLKAGAVSVTVGALVVGGSGIANADRGDDAGSSTNSRASAATKSGAKKASHAAKPAAPSAGASLPAAAVTLPTVTPRAALPSAPKAAATANAEKGPFLGLIGNGTDTHPNAGLIFGNGFSYDAENCAAGKVCNGGNGGVVFGDGGNGFNGGNGGRGGLLGTHVVGLPLGFFVIPFGVSSYAGDGGDAAPDCVAKGITCNGGNGGSSLGMAGGGNGGNGFGTGKGGAGGSTFNPLQFPSSRAFQEGFAKGGNGGLIAGVGGAGGNGGWIIGGGGNGGNGGVAGKGGAGGKGGLVSNILAKLTGQGSANGKNGADSPVTPAAAKATAKAKGGPVLGLFGDGTATHPNAGLIIGNGFSYWTDSCAADKVCNGGNAGLLFGDGGNGYNGGTGGNAGLFGKHLRELTLGLFFAVPLGFYGQAGNGGDAAVGCKVAGITCNGGNGGNAGPFLGFAGNGGSVLASTGGTPGKAGKPGIMGVPGEDGYVYGG